MCIQACSGLVSRLNERDGTRTHRLQLRRLTLYPDELLSRICFKITKRRHAVKTAQWSVITN